MSIEMLSGMIALITSFVGLLPQIYKALKTRSTQDISMLMLINYLICSFAWIIYGGFAGSMFVLVSNILGLFSSFILIIQKRYYDANSY